jgi:chorismate synthase
MPANSFGSRFVVTTFGESHGPALGVVIDGCPSGIVWNEEVLKANLERRRPGASKAVSGRQELDRFELLSGVFEGKTLGTPIAMIVRNLDARSSDYDAVMASPRAGHADDVWKKKFGHSDHRGGGRSSGRETVTRVLAGSVAQVVCAHLAKEMKIISRILKVGEQEFSEQTTKILEQAKVEGESYGGVLEIKIMNPPAGLGQPVFHKLKSDLASAFMSIGAVTAVELGAGVEASSVKGTEFHQFHESKNYGGIRGGISTGEEIQIKVHVKPTSSILDVAKRGRHDPFIGIRVLPVLESMAYLVLADHLLWARTDRT